VRPASIFGALDSCKNLRQGLDVGGKGLSILMRSVPRAVATGFLFWLPRSWTWILPSRYRSRYWSHSQI